MADDSAAGKVLITGGGGFVGHVPGHEACIVSQHEGGARYALRL